MFQAPGRRVLERSSDLDQDAHGGAWRTGPLTHLSALCWPPLATPELEEARGAGEGGEGGGEIRGPAGGLWHIYLDRPRPGDSGC